MGSGNGPPKSGVPEAPKNTLTGHVAKTNHCIDWRSTQSKDQCKCCDRGGLWMPFRSVVNLDQSTNSPKSLHIVHY